MAQLVRNGTRKRKQAERPHTQSGCDSVLEHQHDADQEVRDCRKCGELVNQTVHGLGCGVSLAQKRWGKCWRQLLNVASSAIAALENSNKAAINRWRAITNGFLFISISSEI